MNKSSTAATAGFVEKMAQRIPAFGTFIVTGDPAITEIFGYAGFDFVIIDTEHSPNDIGSVVNHIRAAQVSGLAPLVRVTKNEPSLILRALDSGAGGVVVPQVNSAAEARAAVAAARYAPAGERGVAGVVRAAKYGFTPFPEYLQTANQAQVIVQIEHIDAVANLAEILSVEGIDGIFIGPTDLSQSMGLTGQFNNQALRDVIGQVINQAKATDKWTGIFCVDADDAAAWAAQSAVMLTIATDTMLIAQAARELKKALTKGK